MERKLIYISAPYNGTPEETERRMDIVLKEIGKIQSMGHFVITPLMFHFTMKYITFPSTDDYWYKFSSRLLHSGIDEMIVLKLDGWDKSKGVQIEINTCKELGISIEYKSKETL